MKQMINVVIMESIFGFEPFFSVNNMSGNASFSLSEISSFICLGLKAKRDRERERENQTEETFSEDLEMINHLYHCMDAAMPYATFQTFQTLSLTVHHHKTLKYCYS